MSAIYQQDIKNISTVHIFQIKFVFEFEIHKGRQEGIPNIPPQISPRKS